MVGARDDGFARFEWLTQSVKHVRLEFGKLIEKENAVVREGDFPWTGSRTAPDERCHAGRMMRRAERPVDGQFARHEFAGERMDHRDFQNFRHCVANAPSLALSNGVKISYFAVVRATDATPRNIGTSLKLPP